MNVQLKSESRSKHFHQQPVREKHNDGIQQQHQQPKHQKYVCSVSGRCTSLRMLAICIDAKIE